MLEFLLGRSGVFADTEAEHRYTNQVREAAGAFDHLQSRRCGLGTTPVFFLPVRGHVAQLYYYCCAGTCLPCT